jgi:hypothetical protein
VELHVKTTVSLLPLLLVASVGCNLLLPDDGKLRFDYNFDNGTNGWTAGFADFSPGMEADVEFDSGIRPLPAELGEEQGFFIGATNRSDDLFMYLTRRLGPPEGIVPSATYRVDFVITLASNAPSGCAGVGGSPGESVTLKAGATPTRPSLLLADDGVCRLNVDTGQQSQGGTAASPVGNIANGLPCQSVDLNDPPYVRLQRQHTHTHLVRASSTGELWLIVGTDSGFEGRTELYYEQITVELTPQ